ncbi:MAG: hypothetical protein VX971_05410 [Actinomycetota bacterium]|nr:hypothetical protein [Actinomycetota bacterium]
MNTADLRQQARTAVIEGRNAGLGMDEPVTMKDGSVGVAMRFKGRTRSLRFTEELSNSGAIDIWVLHPFQGAISWRLGMMRAASELGAQIDNLKQVTHR